MCWPYLHKEGLEMSEEVEHTELAVGTLGFGGHLVKRHTMGVGLLGTVKHHSMLLMYIYSGTSKL